MSIYQHTLPKDSILWGRYVTRHEIERSLDSADSLDTLLATCENSAAIIDDQCQRCSNQSSDQFGLMPAQPLFGFPLPRAYCLKCFNMGKMTTETTLYHLASPDTVPLTVAQPYLTWQGQLSPEQARASNDLIDSLSDPSKAHLIYAVTGAGKTEMMFPGLQHILEQGQRACVASPRIDVCLELAPRLQQAFAEIPVQLLYGGQEEPYQYTPLVVATTHQLLRFKHAFDLLVVDEVDAFPYAGDDTLHFAVRRALKPKGKLVYLTATLDHDLEEALKKKELTQTLLPARYHRHPLPEPQFVWIGDWRQAIRTQQKRSGLWRSIQDFWQLDGAKLLFMPSIQMAEALYEWIQQKKPEMAQRMRCVHAKDPERKEKVQLLRDREIDGLITTTILERGVTFTHCHVLIVGAEDRLYSRSALVQMSGRVGRKWDYPTGTLIYGHAGISRSMIEARRQIQMMNQQASQRGLIEC